MRYQGLLLVRVSLNKARFILARIMGGNKVTWFLSWNGNENNLQNLIVCMVGKA